MAVKVLFFIETLTGGGAEKVLCNLVNAMDQSRFDITVQTLWREDPTGHLAPGIHYRSCFDVRTRWNVLRSRAEAASGLLYLLRIRGDYRLECAYLEYGSTKILSRSTNRRAKKLAWVHSDLERKLGGNPEGIRKLKAQYAAFDRIVCVSQTARDSFVRLFGREADTAVLYNTIDDEAIREKALLCPPELPEGARLRVCAVGRLAAEKQYDLLLRVQRRLLDEGLEQELWLVGDGPERQALEASARELGISDSVRFLGYQANPYPWMRAADLLVCSSRYEGFSTFVAEGLILGKPIVTTECSGMRELLGDSEFGLITENNEEALLNGMRRLLTDAALRDRYAVAAVRRGKAFSVKQLARRTEDFLLNTLEE